MQNIVWLTSGVTALSARQDTIKCEESGEGFYHDHAVKTLLHQTRLAVHNVRVGADCLEMGSAWNVEGDLGC